MFTLAHLSDLHATPVRIRRVGSLLNKRAFGWLSWSLRRSKEHRPEVLEALVADLRVERPDHVVVTGDLTNLGLEEEFPAAAVWLRQLGDRQSVSIVPGNHDAYVSVPWSSSWQCWTEYMESDAPANRPEADFPTVRIRGPVALIGVCSAQPTGLFCATGALGRQQLARLEDVLQQLAGSALCRVVLIHHSPVAESVAPRRRLTDAASFREVLVRAGADLVLHGHTHKTALTRLPGPGDPIPVVGVRSSSAIGLQPNRQAQYHIYRIERREGRDGVGDFRITMITRGYNAERCCFAYTGEHAL